MIYLLDTDILSNLLKPTPSMSLLTKLATISAPDQCTSSITLGEMIYGAARLGARGVSLRERIERDLIANLTIVPFDTQAGGRYGTLRASLESRGTPLAEADLRIASIALAYNLTLVTGNVRHFRRVPELVIENWLA